MTAFSEGIRAAVVARAGDRCEYCHLPKRGQAATFPIDHVMPRGSGGETILENLALDCPHCSLRKRAKQTAADPESGEEVPLFNPRTQTWDEHFRRDGMRAVPLTPTGRATVAALAMNRPLIIAIRQEEMARGRHPPR